MPLALLLLIALYIWLVWQRTRGDGGRALAGDEARRVEKLLGFVRVGLVLSSVVLAAAIIWSSARQHRAPATAAAPATVATAPAAPADSNATWADRVIMKVGSTFGLYSDGAALPFFVIIGTAVSYGYVLVATAKVVGYYRWTRHRKRLSAPSA